MATARLARRGELDELLGLYEMLNPDDPALASDDVTDLWGEMVADNSLDIVVVEHDGRLVATCVLSVTKNLTRGARPWSVVENVVERARERDCYKVMLLTGSDEEWKHEFYESCGFDGDEKTGFTMNLG